MRRYPARRQNDSQSMKNRTTTNILLLGISMGALAVSVAQPTLAQNALGGPAKTKPNAIGGASKPAPAIGGATTSASVTKPPTIGNPPRPGSLPSTTTGVTGNAATPGSTLGTARQNPPVGPPNKGKPLVTIPSNLKCGGGSCVAKGKP